jgi:acyl-ACP thioesterase
VRALEMYVNGNKMVGCETFWAVFNTEIRRPEALALPFKHFELYPDQKATRKTFSKINLNNETEMVFEKIVAISDIDIVNHVNNVKYLEWCLDFVDAELILNQKIESFEMNFLKELSLKDKVVIHENLNPESLIISITKEQKTCFALQLNLK